MAKVTIGSGAGKLEFDQTPPDYLSHAGEVGWNRGFNDYIGALQMHRPPVLRNPYERRTSRGAYLLGWDTAKSQHHSEVHRQQEA